MFNHQIHRNQMMNTAKLVTFSLVPHYNKKYCKENDQILHNVLTCHAKSAGVIGIAILIQSFNHAIVVMDLAIYMFNAFKKWLNKI